MKFDSLYSWFHKYAQSYYTADEFLMTRIRLKEDHSLRVVQNALELTKHLKLDISTQRMAEVAALLHDLARFHQITVYGTFIDVQSIDHGDLAINLIKKYNLLQDFPATEKSAIMFAIQWHNKMLVPSNNPTNELMAQVIRDADKLDIFRTLPPIVANHDYSPVLINLLIKGAALPYTEVKTIADKRLVRLGWFYDVNFAWTLNKLIKEGYAQQILDILPNTEPLQQVKITMTNYLTTRLENITI